MPDVTDSDVSSVAAAPTWASRIESAARFASVSVSPAAVRAIFVPVKSMSPAPAVASSVGVPLTSAEAAAV